MAVSYTYGYMKWKIADDLGDRVDLLTPLADLTVGLGGVDPVSDAIQRAIQFWERQRFYFNELVIDYFNYTSYNWVTGNGQEYYGKTTTPLAWTNPDPTLVAGIDHMSVLVSGQRYPLTVRGFPYMADTSVNPAVTGWMVDYGRQANTFRFYPVPNGSYPIVGMLATLKQPPLVAAADANCWTQDAFDLILSQAKLILAEELLQDEDMAAAMRRAIYGEPDNPSRKGYLGALQAENTQRKGRGKIRPTYF